MLITVLAAKYAPDTLYIASGGRIPVIPDDWYEIGWKGYWLLQKENRVYRIVRFIHYNQ